MLVLGAILGASLSINAAPVLIPNGDFATPGGADYSFFESASGVVSFPSSGGNGGGYALIDNTLGVWGGGIVSPPDDFYPNNSGIPLGDLGLVAGETYTFSMDMKNFAGTGTGGLKLESWNDAGVISATADMPASGQSGDWVTYSWDYKVEPGATRIKIVPLLTIASGGSTADSVGIDNIRVDNTPLEAPLLPNGNFETAGGSGWPLIAANGDHSAEFPATGGNDDGFAVIDSVGAADWAVLVGNNNTPISLASLGLSAGETITFKVDMKILEGSNIGGIAVDFVPDGTGDLRPPAVIGDGSTWETYEFEIAIPEGTTLIFVKLVWGVDSRVAYDNITFVPPAPLSASISPGTVVSWEVADPFSSYQAQSSPDGTSWTNLGPEFVGDSQSSTFDPAGAPFYRVLETTEPLVGNAVLNGSFESVEPAIHPSPGAVGWVILSPEDTTPEDGTATMTAESSYTNEDSTVYSPQDGNSMLVIESATPAEGAVVPPNTHVRSQSFAILPETEAPYEVSFYAINLYKEGGANPQYRFQWFDGGGGFVGESPFTSFAGVGDTWTKIETTLTPPNNAATMTFEVIQAMGAGNGSRWVTLIDNVDVPFVDIPGETSPMMDPPTTAPGVEVTFNTRVNRTYQVQSSDSLSGFTNIGDPVTGDGGNMSLIDPVLDPVKYYQVEETTP